MSKSDAVRPEHRRADARGELRRRAIGLSHPDAPPAHAYACRFSRLSYEVLIRAMGMDNPPRAAPARPARNPERDGRRSATDART